MVSCGHEPLVLETAELSALGANRADWPRPGQPEALWVTSGGDDELWWADARGYIHAPLAAVWHAALDPEVGVDRREVSDWTVTPDPVPGLAASYRVDLLVEDVITVEYELWWRHELQKGTEADPQLVVAVWAKTDGTPFIDLLQGSLVLRRAGDDLTEVELQEELKAALRDDATVVSYLQDFFASLVAASHGQPLPVW